MKFQLGDIIKSNRNGTIGFDNIFKIVQILKDDQNKMKYRIRRSNVAWLSLLLLDAAFVDKNYNLFKEENKK